MSNKKKIKTSLASIILDDLLRHHKLSLLLLLLIIASTVSVLLTTQQTRRELFQREQLLLERDVLASEWRNLVIEENVLADPKRIEQKAKNKLGMEYVLRDNETILVIKKL